MPSIVSQMPSNTPDAVGRRIGDLERTVREVTAAQSTPRGSALWLPNKAYRAGDLAVEPGGTLVVALETHTSGATFSANVGPFPARWQTVNAPSPASPPPPVFSATQNAAQTASPANTWIAVLFDVELIDTHDGHSNTTNPSRYTIPAGRGGVWSFQGTVAMDGTGSGGVCLSVNGVRVKGSAVAKPSGPPGAFTTPAKLVTVAAGDYVEVLWVLGAATGTYVQSDFASSFDARFVQ